MTVDELIEAFEELDDDYGNFSLIENKLSNRPDLHAFILLDKLVPGTMDMVSAAEHDEIWLDVSLELLAKVITKEQVIELSRCGVYVDEYGEGLHRYV